MAVPTTKPAKRVSRTASSHVTGSRPDLAANRRYSRVAKPTAPVRSAGPTPASQAVDDGREHEERERRGGFPERRHDHAHEKRDKSDENREKISVDRGQRGLPLRSYGKCSVKHDDRSSTLLGCDASTSRARCSVSRDVSRCGCRTVRGRQHAIPCSISTTGRTSSTPRARLPASPGASPRPRRGSIERRVIPPLVIVGIDHGELRRAREYLPVEDERNPFARDPLASEYADVRDGRADAVHRA